MSAFWAGFCAIYRRELGNYLATPLAYVFVAAFLAAASLSAFQLGGLFEAMRADMQIYFQFHPWLYVFFMPALAMRAWTEEGQSGTLETLLSLPVPTAALVLGKFGASWSIAAITLVFSTPLWIALSWLGPVDHGVTLLSYLASFLLAGACLAIGMAMSAAGRSQVVAFVLAASICFVLIGAGLPVVSETLAGFIGNEAARAVTALSLLDPFDGMTRGVLEVRALVYFALTTASWLGVTWVLVDAKRRAGG